MSDLDLDRLRDAHTALADPSEASVEAARSRLRAVMDAETLARRERPRRRRRRRLTMAVAATAAATLLTIAVWPTSRSGTGGPSTAQAARLCLTDATGPAAACLEALGDLAGADDVLAQGKVFYRRDLWSQSIMYIGPGGRPQAEPRGEGVFGIVRAGTEELWIAPDGSGRVVYGPPQTPYLPSAADQRAWRAAGSPDIERLAGASDARDGLPARSFGPGELDAALLGDLASALPKGGSVAGLPTDPEELRDELLRIAWAQRLASSGGRTCPDGLDRCSGPARRDVDARYGANLTLLLRHPFAAPELRRALLQLFGDIPSAQRLGAVRDPTGRLGAAILIPPSWNNGLNVIVFDAASGRLLADGTAADGTSDTLRWHGIYDLEVAGVDTIGDRP